MENDRGVGKTITYIPNCQPVTHAAVHEFAPSQATWVPSLESECRRTLSATEESTTER